MSIVKDFAQASAVISDGSDADIKPSKKVPKVVATKIAADEEDSDDGKAVH